MKWSLDKNLWLRKERNISFEEVLFYIEKGWLLDVLEHPNTKKYSGQKLFVVNIRNYVYIVPFIETDDEIFLKTIIPSRKATKKYLD